MYDTLCSIAQLPRSAELPERHVKHMDSAGPVVSARKKIEDEDI